MNKFDHSLLILRKNFENSDRSMYAICVGWVNFVHSLRCLLKNLRSQQKIYATAGPTGRDKYHLCLTVHCINFEHPWMITFDIAYMYKCTMYIDGKILEANIGNIEKIIWRTSLIRIIMVNIIMSRE